jgi:hypothetical protein
MHKHSKRIRILLETIIVALLIALQVFIIAVSSIDLEQYRPAIMKNLNDSLGGEVRLGKIEFSLFPYFGVKGHDFFLFGNEDTPTIEADEVIIGVYLFRLIRGDVVPKKLRVISPTLFFTVRKDERLLDKVLDIVGRTAPKGGGEISLREVVITRASVRITDERPEEKREYVVAVSSVSFSGNLKEGPLEYSVSLAPPGGIRGTIRSSGERLPDGGVDARVWVKGVDLDALNLLSGDYGPLTIKGTVSGIIDVTYHAEGIFEVDGRIVGTGLEFSGSPYYPEGMRIEEIDCTGDVSVTPTAISVRHLVVSRDSLEVRADVVLREAVHRAGTAPDLTVSADIAGFDLGRDVSLVPLGLIGGEAREDAERLLVGGRLSAHVDVAGNPAWLGTKGARLAATGRVTDATLDLGGAIVRGLSADISLSGDEVTVTDVSFREPRGNISELKWRVVRTFRAPFIRDLVVVVDDIGFEDVKDILASDVVNALGFLRPTEGEGTVRGRMVIDAPMGNTPGVPEATGRVDMADWSIQVPFLTKKPLPGSAALLFERDRMVIPPTTLTFDESVLVGEGELTNLGKPRLMMSLTSPGLDLVELFGTGDKTVKLKDLTARLIFEEGYLLLEDLTCTLYGGRCTGKFGYVYTGSEKEDLFYLDLTGKGADFGRLLAEAGITKDLTGTGDFVLSLRSDPGNPDVILKTFDGTAQISMKNGTIKRLSVLSKIVSLMKISNYLRLSFPKLDTEGVPFESITGTFTIENGVAETENLFFDSRVMKVSIVGSYDMSKDNLDMVMGFQLLQTIDLIVNKIPVVGYVLTGDDGNLFTTYFRVTGSLDDPTVTTMTLQALGRGTLNIFGRIFRFPLKGFIPR